jgi:hypothetical protein
MRLSYGQKLYRFSVCRNTTLAFATIWQQYPVLIMVTSFPCQMSLDAHKKHDLPRVNLRTTAPLYRKIDANPQQTRNLSPSSQIRALACVRDAAVMAPTHNPFWSPSCLCNFKTEGKTEHDDGHRRSFLLSVFLSVVA